VKRDGAALAFAMAFPSIMTWLEFKVLPGEHAEGHPALGAVFAAGKVVQFAFPLLYVAWFERDRLRPARPAPRGLALGAAFGLAVGAGAIALYHTWLRHTGLMTDTPARVHGWLVRMRLGTPAAFVGMAVFMSVLHSFLEEYYWRWFVFGWLRRHVPDIVAMVVSALAFMAHHVIILSVYLPGQFWMLAVPFSLCVAGGGVAWAWLYERAQSLYAPWVSHMLIDAALMVIGYEMLLPYWAT
jgi:membrane protease YdiL (CAAX protease family)